MHAIDMSNNRANIAFVNEVPWHQLGVKLDENATIDQWAESAGLSWSAVKSPIQFMDSSQNVQTYTGRSVIYRDDTDAPLGVVGDDYQIVQPRDVVEFFNEAAGQANMKLEVAGSLFGGRRFWATARVDEAALKLNGVDEVRPYVLLITSADGSLATNVTLVNTRVVCNNTAKIALSENGARVRVTHASEFDPNLVKNKLGLIDNAWASFKDRITSMATTKVTDKQAAEFFIKLMMNEAKQESVSKLVERKAEDLLNRFKNGIGAEMHKGTAWGLYCATTEYTNYHGRGKLDARMQAALNGPGAQMVTKAENMIAELV